MVSSRGFEDVGLEVVAHELHGDVGEGAAVGNSGVVEQHVNVVGECVRTVDGVVKVELDDLQFKPGLVGGTPQFPGLRPDLDAGDDPVVESGEVQGRTAAETASRARDEDCLAHGGS